MERILNNKLREARLLFEKETFYKYILINDIDCSELPSSDTDGKELPKAIIDRIFKPLHSFDDSEIEINSCPAVYAFELCNENDRDRVLGAFIETKKITTDRKLPALKKKPPYSKYLYVGKVEKEVGGRIVTHLGYYQSNGNHGLQLAYWARELKPKVKVNLHVFRFIEEFRPYVSAMEVILAKELNPIIGKH